MRIRTWTRRRFLGGAGAAVAAPWVIPATALGAEGRPPASERIVMGAIGLGGRAIGQQVLHNFLAEPAVQMVAVCDVQAPRRVAGQTIVNDAYGARDCAAYRDLRGLLARNDIDAVTIATGDRWHAPASVLAAKAGKDVYCEKPMSLTIAEGRAVADTMRALGRVYQGGTQRRSVPKFHYAAEIARAGKLGKLQTVIGYTPPFIPNIGAFQARPPQHAPSRDVVDWDLWLGPVAWRPYNADYIGGLGGWSYIPDMGGGGITDWGTHQSDLTQFANDAELTSPVAYRQLGPHDVEARYANGVRLVFHDGIPAGGCLMVRFEGAEGWISVDDNLGFDADPPSLLGAYKRREASSYEKASNHIQDFLKCIRTRQQPVCNAEVAQRATTACHNANLCVCLGRPLTWDPAKEAFVGDDVANRMRSRALREPWRL